ncbi:response regulator [Tenacibaculum maritimum]|uniref:response regulator n=1 Tax=Tenacibaculum maritimum TaxID=107401 RepID=UPI0012E4D1E6|nr:response regulator [Tenacibaculum maritimum]MCD9563564.1 response regulator [Tenacibaculum maritimum]MCD9566729.1 response regulator [Tenacibaculum maritimum]MCD9579986.1 response regulator [Tenacibaculum maritimum]MCD9597543.1 response regulator [Tenacibaculum maritimum]MCD9614631.1 response regulator [Tenacibaculum maritimum]
MKLEYKILWLDDKIEEFKELEVIEEVETHLKENGFIPKIKTVDNSTDFFNHLDGSYDLILTDFHMNDMNGNEVVQMIRSSKYSVMTEILFYTAKADLKDAKKISRVSFLETNSTTDAHIEKVISRTIELIDLTVKKFQHIVTMRGMIMHETSSLDTLMITIIKKALKNDKIDFSTLSEEIYEQLIALFAQKKDFVEKCKERKSFNKLTKDNFVFSAKYKILTLSKILENLKLPDFSTEYDEEINSIRNKFAHAELQTNEDGREFFKYKEEGIDFDDELCKKIREDIIKHKNNLDKLNIRLEN